MVCTRGIGYALFDSLPDTDYRNDFRFERLKDVSENLELLPIPFQHIHVLFTIMN